jgi:hypothetical protein
MYLIGTLEVVCANSFYVNGGWRENCGGGLLSC